MAKIGVVVPSNRPDQLKAWKEAWQPHLDEAEARLYVVEDTPETWESIKATLGRDAWIIPVKTDCIRSYGYLRAYRDGMDYIVTLDDDVRPDGDVNAITYHVTQLQQRVEPDNWERSLRSYGAPPTRGLPLIRRVILNHGLWRGIPDVSAQTQLDGYDVPLLSEHGDSHILRRGFLFPMSGMNLAWVRAATPYMYFGLQGYDIREPTREWGAHRCGDILAGVISKTVFDWMPGVAVRSGTPFVYHDRASDPVKNLELEKPTMLLPYIMGVVLRGAKTYTEVAERLHHLEQPWRRYGRDLGQAMRIWWRLTHDSVSSVAQPD